MTNDQILRIALAQSAIDANCQSDDFTRAYHVIVPSKPHKKARKYLEFPIPCNLISYGTNIVASIDMEYEEIVRSYLDAYPVEHCFETPNLQVLNQAFEERGMQVCFMAEYFLPDMSAMAPLPCEAAIRLLGPADFAALYRSEWSNALCEKRRDLDVLGMGAYDGEELIGLAACSADCGEMWQIGVDVLPAHRRRGIASALTSRLALEILARGKVPFYCCAWSNLGSARNAIKSGFRPAWVELTVKPKEYVDSLNCAARDAGPVPVERSTNI